MHHPGASGGGGLAEGFGLDHRPLHLRIAEGEIHLAHHRQLLLLDLFHRFKGAAALFALQTLGTGGTQLAQVVQVGVAEQQPGLGGVAVDQGQGLGGHRVAGEIDQIELPAPFAQKGFQGEHEGGVDELDAAALERLAVAGQPGQVEGQQGHLPAQLLEQLHLHQGGMAAGIAVGPRGFLIEAENAPNDAAVLDGFGGGVVGLAAALEGGGPLLLENGAVDRLEALQPAGGLGVGAAAEALVVDHPGQGL